VIALETITSKNTKAVAACTAAAAACTALWPFVGLILVAMARHHHTCSAPAMGFATAVVVVGILRAFVSCLAPVEGDAEEAVWRRVGGRRERVMVTAAKVEAKPYPV